MTPWGVLKQLREQPLARRRIGNWFVIAGSGFASVAAILVAAHFAFDAALINADTGQPATDNDIFSMAAFFWSAGLIFAGAGILPKRWIGSGQ